MPVYNGVKYLAMTSIRLKVWPVYSRLSSTTGTREANFRFADQLDRTTITKVLLFQPRVPVQHYGYWRVRGLLNLHGNQEAAIPGDVKPSVHGPGKAHLEERFWHSD